MESMMTARQVAELLGVHENWVYDHAASGELPSYKIGGAHLATHVGSKVVPVAHNAGELWPRNAFIKKPGTIVLSVGPVIDAAGRSDAEVNAEVEAWIEGEMRRISPHRYADARS